MLNLFQGGKVTSDLSALRSKDSNCKGGDAAGSGMGRIGGSSSRSDSGMYPGDSAVGEATAGSGCSLAERHHPPVVYTLGTPALVHKEHLHKPAL
nr:hypothetical protein [Tanacetum cinerariifolium]